MDLCTECFTHLKSGSHHNHQIELLEKAMDALKDEVAATKKKLDVILEKHDHAFITADTESKKWKDATKKEVQSRVEDIIRGLQDWQSDIDNEIDELFTGSTHEIENLRLNTANKGRYLNREVQQLIAMSNTSDMDAYQKLEMVSEKIAGLDYNVESLSLEKVPAGTLTKGRIEFASIKHKVCKPLNFQFFQMGKQVAKPVARAVSPK